MNNKAKRLDIFSKEYWKGRTYAIWALYLPVYLMMFFGVEKIIGRDYDYIVSYMPLDDAIPFNEYFILAYYLWYPLLVGVGLYAMFKDGSAFRKYMLFIAVSYTASLIFFLIVPNGQDLRPEVFAHDNFCVDMVRSIYAADTNTNVFPSVHVIGSLGAAFAVFDCKGLKEKKWLKILVIFVAALISISTVFVKQHSALDIIGGLAFSAVSYVIVYVWLEKKVLKPLEEKKPYKPGGLLD